MIQLGGGGINKLDQLFQHEIINQNYKENRGNKNFKNQL